MAEGDDDDDKPNGELHAFTGKRPPLRTVEGCGDAPEIDLEDESPQADNDEALYIRMTALVTEHADLDAAIFALEATGTFDRLSLQRMKKRKLALKDAISELRDKITPDIIA